MNETAKGLTARKSVRTVLLAGVAAAMMGGALFVDGSALRAQTAVTPQIQATAPNGAPSFADLADRVKPAVVSVRVKVATAATVAQRGGPSMDGLPPEIQEFFRRFGQGPQGPGERGEDRPGRFGEALGSGFFISADGYAVTNHHVIENALEVKLMTEDGRELPATVVGSDPRTDIALLKVTTPGSYPFVKLATASPRVGEWVMAVGNPFGLGGTVTAGIVSARGRDIGAGPYDDFLQIDAPVNRGNSGGPTFNLAGEVVGVNTAIASPTGGSVGIAFAVPAATVQTVAASLKQSGEVSRGYLGVQVQPVTADIAETLGLREPKGALVAEVTKGSAAEKAGLKSGDVVTAFDGTEIKTARDLTRLVGSAKPGAEAKLTFMRQGKTETADVVLSKLPEMKPRA